METLVNELSSKDRDIAKHSRWKVNNLLVSLIRSCPTRFTRRLLTTVAKLIRDFARGFEGNDVLLEALFPDSRSSDCGKLISRFQKQERSDSLDLRVKKIVYFALFITRYTEIPD